MKFLGVSDDITTCQQCGKKNLKRTVALELDNGSVVHYGCDCAAKAFKRRTIKTSNVQFWADIVARAQRWILKYEPQVVLDGIRKRGVMGEIKNGVVRLETSLGIIEIVRPVEKPQQQPEVQPQPVAPAAEPAPLQQLALFADIAPRERRARRARPGQLAMWTAANLDTGRQTVAPATLALVLVAEDPRTPEQSQRDLEARAQAATLPMF